MIVSDAWRGAFFFLAVSALALQMSLRPVASIAAEEGTAAAVNARSAARPAAAEATETAGVVPGPHAQSIVGGAEPPAGAVVDPLQACFDGMNKLTAKLKFKDMAGHENFEEIGRRVKRIENAIKTGGDLYSPDGTSASVPRKKLEEMLVAEKERLDEARKAITHSRDELDDMMAAALHIEDGSPEKPVLCPANGAYSVTQDEKLRYIVKCSVHGDFNEVRAKLYEKAMKSADPGRFCRGNISAIVGACERYSIDYGVPAEWRLETLIEEGYLDGECVCPAGGVYSIKGGFGKDFTCSCSVHK